MHGVSLKNKNFELQGQKLQPCHKRNMDLCRRLVRYENSWVLMKSFLERLKLMLTRWRSQGQKSAIQSEIELKTLYLKPILK